MSIISLAWKARIGFFGILLPGVLFLLILAGCSAPRRGGSEPTPTPSPLSVSLPPANGEPTLEPYQFTTANGAPFPVPSTEANPIQTVDRDVAWGTGLNIKEIKASIDEKHVFVLKAVAEDGKFIVGIVGPLTSADQDPLKLAVMDVAGQQITEIATIQSPPDTSYSTPFDYSTWIDVSVDGDWVVWQEGSTLKVYNVATQAMPQVETITDKAGGTSGFSQFPFTKTFSVDHGVLVWMEGSEETPEKNLVSSLIKMEDLATSSVSVIGRHGVNPAISWPTVAWMEPDFISGTEGGIWSRIVTLDIKTGAMGHVGDLHDLSGININGDTVVSAGIDGVTLLENLAQTRRQVITPMDGDGRSRFTLNDRLVTWVSGGTVQVWDRQLERLVNLGGYAIGIEGRIVNGHTLAWQSIPTYDDWMNIQPPDLLPGNMTIYMMDTAQLSK